MVIAGAALLVMQAAAGQTPVGIAAVAQNGQICVAMPGLTLPSGTSVTLVQPAPPQSVRRATVVANGPSCERLERALISGPYYVAQAPASEAGDADAFLWLAFPGRLTTRALDSGAVAVQLGPAYPNAQVRSCASAEGVHLTVWAGAPFESNRLWHQYYYLGYDVEPSCTDRDVRQERGSPTVPSERRQDGSVRSEPRHAGAVRWRGRRRTPAWRTERTTPAQRASARSSG